MQWFLIAVFLVSLLVQMGYYLMVYLRLPLYRQPKRRNTGRGTSVVICARNESENLQRFLPTVLEQDYPEYEVVVVNDASTDDTEDVLARFSARYRHLRYTTIPCNDKFSHGKKLALTVGIKSARYDLLLLTDADCSPVTGQWLRKMVSNLSGERKIVLGYGKYEKRKGMLNCLIRYETVFTAIQYFSFAIIGKPYMGVGRNLAYRKSLFFENRGFASHYHLASGDDDLFVNETATGKNTAVELSKESHTVSVPETSFGEWVKQKQRHLSAGNHYRTASRIRLAGELFSRFLLYATLVAACILSPWKWHLLMAFGVLTAVKLLVFKLGMKRLDERDLLLPSLLFDPLLPVLLGVIWFSNIFITRYQSWK
ncbi:MAG TPA: glycosyltransferase [Bacteroides sp.]|nr:glycosyltransferase [Bacteroides sp.]